MLYRQIRVTDIKTGDVQYDKDSDKEAGEGEFYTPYPWPRWRVYVADAEILTEEERAQAHTKLTFVAPQEGELAVRVKFRYLGDDRDKVYDVVWCADDLIVVDRFVIPELEL